MGSQPSARALDQADAQPPAGLDRRSSELWGYAWLAFAQSADLMGKPGFFGHVTFALAGDGRRLTRFACRPMIHQRPLPFRGRAG
jgi:hypothetical protein